MHVQQHERCVGQQTATTAHTIPLSMLCHVRRIGLKLHERHAEIVYAFSSHAQGHEQCPMMGKPNLMTLMPEQRPGHLSALKQTYFAQATNAMTLHDGGLNTAASLATQC